MRTTLDGERGTAIVLMGLITFQEKAKPGSVPAAELAKAAEANKQVLTLYAAGLQALADSNRPAAEAAAATMAIHVAELLRIKIAYCPYLNKADDETPTPSPRHPAPSPPPAQECPIPSWRAFSIPSVPPRRRARGRGSDFPSPGA